MVIVFLSCLVTGPYCSHCKTWTYLSNSHRPPVLWDFFNLPNHTECCEKNVNFCYLAQTCLTRWSLNLFTACLWSKNFSHCTFSLPLCSYLNSTLWTYLYALFCVPVLSLRKPTGGKSTINWATWISHAVLMRLKCVEQQRQKDDVNRKHKLAQLHSHK